MSYSLVMLLLVTSIISAIPSSIILAKAAGDFPSYEHCAPYTCANSTIQYPFGICGLLYAYCDEAYQTILSTQSSVENPITETWRVVGDITKSSYFTQTLQITPSDIYSNFEYSASSYDWLLKGGFFNLSDAYMAGTIVNCTQPPADIFVNNSKKLDCTESNTYCFFYPHAGVQIPSCDNYPLIVPTNKSYNISADKDFEQLQQTGFQITWSHEFCYSCNASGGRCYSQFASYFYDEYPNYNTYCIYPNDDVHYSDCNDGSVIQYGKRVQYRERKRLSAKDMAAIFFALCAVFSIVVVSCIMVRRQSCCCQRSSSEQSIRAFMDPVDSRPPSVENFLNYYSSQAPARYSYSQIMTDTNNLEQKVGKGGFGTVYNGLLIAVKILDESKQSEQQFIAEVATVGTTCHNNLVRLLGYCSHGSKRALVYEYMVNGSLDRHIHGDHKDELDWKQLFSIAVVINVWRYFCKNIQISKYFM